MRDLREGSGRSVKPSFSFSRVITRSAAQARISGNAALRPYLPQLMPYLDELLPHLPRILGEMQHLRPYLPVLVPILPRLLPHTQTLLDELPYLIPYLDEILDHSEVILPLLDDLAPLCARLRPHLQAICCRLGTLEPLLPRIVPHLGYVLPHMQRCLAHWELILPSLNEVLAPNVLETLLPHIGAIASALPKVALHLPLLVSRLEVLRPVLSVLFATLPDLLPHLGVLLHRLDEKCCIHDQPLSLLLEDKELLMAQLAAPEIGVKGGGDDKGVSEEEPALWGVLRKALSFMSNQQPEVTADATDAQEGESSRPDPPMDLASIKEHIDAAARRMRALEEEFLERKNCGGWRGQQEHDAAVRLSRVEGSLIEVEDRLLSIAGDTKKLNTHVESIEHRLGAEAIARAKDNKIVRQKASNRRSSFVDGLLLHMPL